MIPLPTVGTNLYTAAPSQPTNWREELVRVDHNINDRMRVMFRYAHDSWDTVTATPLWTNAGSFPTVETNFVGPATSMVARLTAAASPTLLNEFVFTHTTHHIVLTPTGTPINFFLSFEKPSQVSTVNSFADLLVGKVASFGQASAQPKYYNRYKIFEPYFQDDFHATKRLTLNLGIRLSLFGTYRERYHNAFNFDPATWVAANAPQVNPADGSLTGGNPFNVMVQCGTHGVPDGCMQGHLFNPAPRIGFAFDPKGDGTWAIRGGYGIFFDHTNGNESTSEALEGAPPLVNTPTHFNVAGYQNIR
jgi:hypothetical protein